MEGIHDVINNWLTKIRTDKENIKQSIQSRERIILLGILDYLGKIDKVRGITEIREIIISSLRAKTSRLLEISVAQLGRLTRKDNLYSECEKRIRELREELKRLSHLK